MVECKNYYRLMIKKKIHWLMKKTLQQVDNLKKLQYNDNLSSLPRARIALPYLLNQIRLENCMCFRVANFAWSLKIRLIAWMVVIVNNWLRDNMLDNVIIKCKLVVIPPVLDNYALKKHALTITPISFFLQDEWGHI